MFTLSYLDRLNQASLSRLMEISRELCVSFIINNGRITGLDWLK
jgi:hypothetical protein